MLSGPSVAAPLQRVVQSSVVEWGLIWQGPGPHSAGARGVPSSCCALVRLCRVDASSWVHTCLCGFVHYAGQPQAQAQVASHPERAATAAALSRGPPRQSNQHPSRIIMPADMCMLQAAPGNGFDGLVPLLQGGHSMLSRPCEGNRILDRGSRRPVCTPRMHDQAHYQYACHCMCCSVPGSCVRATHGGYQHWDRGSMMGRSPVPYARPGSLSSPSASVVRGQNGREPPL